MTKPTLLFIITIFITLTTYGQQVQWASSLIDASSSYREGFFFKPNLQYNQYSAQQALNQSNVLPSNGGDSPNAWIPQKPDKQSFIKVGFAQPMPIQQIAVAESRNPGAVYQIYCYDAADQEHLVATLDPAPVNTEARMLNVFIDPTSYDVAAVKLVLAGGLVPGYNAIDAVAISSSPVPVTAEIAVAEGINPDLVLEPLAADIDTAAINFSPIIAPDGQMLFFGKTSAYNVGGLRDPEDIWYMERLPDGTWGEPKNAGRTLNNKGSNYVSAVTASDSNYVLLLGNSYQEDGKMRAGVSKSTRTASGWTKPEPMQIENFYNNSDIANYHLSEDQRYLLMSVQREDSQGQRDLYVSFRNDDNIWTEPRNLGNQVNSADVESSPYLADDSTLYFSSRGFSGFGGEDVFVSHRLDDTWTNWSTPENMGPVINSEKDDLFFNISPGSEYAFLTRGTSQQADMYQIKTPIYERPANMYVVKGLVYNVKKNAPVAANVVFDRIADSTTTTSSQTNTNEQGQYEMTLPPGEYDVYAEKEGYATLDRQRIRLGDLDSDEDGIILRDIYLSDQVSDTDLKEALATKQKAIASEEVLFELNSYQLDRRTHRQLDQVAEFMQENRDATLRVAGHTCSRGTDEYNQKLSKQRAQSVVDYLAQKGINQARLRTRGYGESRPLVKNSSEANRRLNRRVEFEIL